MKNENKTPGKKKGILMIIMLVFFVGLGLLSYALSPRQTVSEREEKGSEPGEGRGVIFMQPNLYIFNDRQLVGKFPDIVKMHYPYLLVIKPGNTKQTTTVYNLETQKKEKILSKIALDYFTGDILYTAGATTFFNIKDIELRCDYGFIKKKTEILCVTARKDDPLENKLVSLNPQDLEMKDIYSSDNLLGTVSIINGKLFIAEQNIITHKTFLTIDGITKEIPTQADIIYPMNNRIFYATFRVGDIGREASFYEVILHGEEIQTKLVEKEKIVFF